MTLCGSCGEEVRFGSRNGLTAWWHREDVDHHAVLGQPHTAEMQAEIERQLDLPRTRTVTRSKKVKGETISWTEEEIYTVRQLDLERYRKSKKFRDMEALEHADEDDDDPVAPLPPVEIPRHDVEVADLPPRSGMRQIANLILKTEGWELRRVTAARGPYTGSRGELLSISDSLVIGGVYNVDTTKRWVVGSWRDGKFDFAYAGTGNRLHRKINATEMKDWIRGNDLPDPSTSTD